MSNPTTTQAKPHYAVLWNKGHPYEDSETWLSKLVGVYESKDDALVRLLALSDIRSGKPKALAEGVSDTQIMDWNMPDEYPCSFEPGEIYSSEGMVFGCQLMLKETVLSFWMEEVVVKEDGAEDWLRSKARNEEEYQEKFGRAAAARDRWFEKNGVSAKQSK